MKLLVNFEDKEIEIENDSPLKVEHLVNYLKNHFNIDKKRTFKLSNNTKYFDDSDILNEDDKDNLNLFLVEVENYKIKFEDKNEVDMTLLIQEVTNASKKIEIDNKKQSSNSLGDIAGIGNFEQLLQLLNNQSESEIPLELRDQILNIFRAQVPPDSDRGSQLESSQSLPVLNIQPDPNLMQQLGDMGFSEDRCRKVLLHTNNEINAATELLLTEQDLYLPDCNIFI